MADNVNAEVSTPSAEEVFNEYFKKSQSIIGVLNPNIFWQLYNDANPSEEADSEEKDNE